MSRRRILFETVNDTKPITQQHDKSPQHPSVNEIHPPPSLGASPAFQKLDGHIQYHLGIPATLQPTHGPNLHLPKSVSAPAIRPNTNVEQGTVTFSDYAGCFTDDGSPLIEQHSLSEPLLKRDRQLNHGQIASVVAASPPQGFSLASQQLLLQQQQLQQQINQQQLNIQKLNVSLLQDATASRSSNNGRDGLLANSSMTASTSSNTQLSQMPLSTTVNTKSELHEAGASPQLRPESTTQLEVNPARFLVCGCFLNVMFLLQEAMRHFLQFREASLKKMQLLEQENASLKSKLHLDKTKLDLQHESAGIKSTQDLDRRFNDMKMSYDQQILDLQACTIGERWQLFYRF